MSPIGFDVDGVLAKFTAAYQRLFVRIDGRELFQPGDEENPPTWHWPQMRGYSEDTAKSVWEHIMRDPSFWSRLAPLDGAETLSMCIAELERKHDVYFITNRPGENAKQQTEEWLRNYIGLTSPTVLISGDKAACCAALKLTAYVDDFLENIEACVQANADERVTATVQQRKLKFDTRLFLLNRNYNQSSSDAGFTRVRSVGQMLDYLTLGI